jgi:hypothetical protein
MTGTGELTSNHPSALAFDKNGVRTYVVYNFTSQSQTITYSDGMSLTAGPNGFTIESSGD